MPEEESHPTPYPSSPPPYPYWEPASPPPPRSAGAAGWALAQPRQQQHLQWLHAGMKAKFTAQRALATPLAAPGERGWEQSCGVVPKRCPKHRRPDGSERGRSKPTRDRTDFSRQTPPTCFPQLLRETSSLFSYISFPPFFVLLILSSSQNKKIENRTQSSRCP